MADFDDPLTGEKVQASINEWGDILDFAAQETKDLLGWVNGEITTTQIASGDYLEEWAAADKLGAGRYSPKVLSTQEIKARLSSIDKSSAALNGLPTGQKLPTVVAAKIAAPNLSLALGPSMDAKIEATRQTLLGSKWEAQLVTPDMLQAAGFNPQQPFAGDPTTLAAASPLQGLNPKLAEWGRDDLNKALVFKHNCVLQAGPEPDSLVGLARQAARLFPLPAASAPDYAPLKYKRDQSLHQWIR